MTKNELIKKITPIYNYYRKNKLNINSVSTVEIMWQIGDIIKEYLKNANTKPHTLYRDIYGKSEGINNVEQKSYITREFLNRCFRIRKIFETKNNIKKIFPSLNNYNHFREAMPFFDNSKYKLKGNEKNKLLEILNSNNTNQQIMKYIRKLQKEKIGINNPRTQRFQELSNEKKLFIDLYNFLYICFKERKYKEATTGVNTTNEFFISELSKNTGALASDKLMIKIFKIPTNVSGLWLGYAEVVNKLAGKKDATERRRFRRLIPPEKMMRMSEMIYALRSEEDFNKFRL